MVFPAQPLIWLARQHGELFGQLGQVEDELKGRFSGLDEAIDALMLSILSGEALLLVGPPGTAKSRLIRAFCNLLGLLDLENPQVRHPHYFEYLLTPFTEPGELFGFYDVAQAATHGRLVRLSGDWLQSARVVYLDEVFNGSSAILNSLLAVMNERVFHDRGERTPVQLQCLFAATNEIPDTPELRAVFDRFLLRCTVKNVDVHVPGGPERVGTLLTRGWAETFGSRGGSRVYTTLLELADDLRDEIRELTDRGVLQPQERSPFFQELARLIRITRDDDLSEMSNRRLVKMLHIMLLHCVYRSVRRGELDERSLTLGPAELGLVGRFFLDRADDEVVRKLNRALVR
ncbi:MAG: AAA family ATPase [Chloroflexi bacterium]|nr:AAA family ATPase [Chloroflexota bacterium]